MFELQSCARAIGSLPKVWKAGLHETTLPPHPATLPALGSTKYGKAEAAVPQQKPNDAAAGHFLTRGQWQACPSIRQRFGREQQGSVSRRRSRVWFHPSDALKFSSSNPWRDANIEHHPPTPCKKNTHQKRFGTSKSFTFRIAVIAIWHHLAQVGYAKALKHGLAMRTYPNHLAKDQLRHQLDMTLPHQQVDCCP